MKKWIATVILATILMTTMIAPVVAVEVIYPSLEHSTAIARADDIRWVYQVRDGHLWKCLFNYTRNEFVGDWIKC